MDGPRSRSRVCPQNENQNDALLTPYWRLLAIAFVALLVEGAADLLEPWPLKIIFDNVIGSKQMPSGLAHLIHATVGLVSSVTTLDKESGTLEIGKPVLTIGYPNGLTGLALLPEKEAVGLMDECGASLTGLPNELAKRKLIRPIMTQGHIRDMYKNRIVVDAMTTQGSSGTPMFGETGKVVGVKFAVLADDPTSNFAVGIQRAIEQLRITYL